MKEEDFFHGKGLPQIPKGLWWSRNSFNASNKALL